MSFIIKNEQVLNFFLGRKKSGHLSHAYIIEGAEGSGKLTLARAVVCSLLCESKNSPCYSCPSCQKVMSGTHQDIYEIVHRDKTKQISIQQIRDLLKEVYIKPAESERRVFIIENAQQMSDDAQNSLLQVFEEPPKNVMFFLLTESRNLLLPTLKSRAVTLKTENLSDSDILDELKKRFPLSSDLYNRAVIIANGALGKAISFIESEGDADCINLVSDYFTALCGYTPYANLAKILSVKSVSDREKLFLVMKYFTLAVRDILTSTYSEEDKRMFFSEDFDLTPLSERLTKKKLICLYDTVLSVMKDYSKMNVMSAVCEINMIMCSDFER